MQIETRGGLYNLDAILAVPGVDGAYIGPSDLSLSHGAGPNWRHDNTVLHEMTERILASCRSAGKLAVAHTADPAEAVYWGSLGFDMVTTTSDPTSWNSGLKPPSRRCTRAPGRTRVMTEPTS